MLKVTVVKPEAKLITWGATDIRRAGSMRVQEAWLHTIEPDGTPSFAPSRFEVTLRDARINRETGEVLEPEQSPYAPGEYTLHPSSVYLNRDGRPALSVRLTPWKKSV